MEDTEPAPDVTTVKFKVQYGKSAVEVEKPTTTTVGDLKKEVETTLGIPPEYQKLMFKGMLKNDDDTLEQVGLKSGAKILLIATKPSDIAATKAAPAATSTNLKWDAPTEPLSKQQPHAKIISKGKPEGAWDGMKDKQVQLTDAQTYIPGLYNSQGTKVRLTFKPEIQQVWIGSATSTQKVAYSMISKIEAHPIDGQEEYSIMSLNVGHGAASRYWLYFVPSQYVASIKIRILGVASLL